MSRINVDQLLQERASEIEALLGSTTVGAHRGKQLSDADDALVLDHLFALRYLLSFKTVAKAEAKLEKALNWRNDPRHRELFSRPLVQSLLTGDLSGMPSAVWRSRQCQCGTVSTRLSRDGAPVTLVRISLSDIEVCLGLRPFGLGNGNGDSRTLLLTYPYPFCHLLAGNVQSYYC